MKKILASAAFVGVATFSVSAAAHENCADIAFPTMIPGGAALTRSNLNETLQRAAVQPAQTPLRVIEPRHFSVVPHPDCPGLSLARISLPRVQMVTLRAQNAPGLYVFPAAGQSGLSDQPMLMIVPPTRVEASVVRGIATMVIPRGYESMVQQGGVAILWRPAA